MVPDRSVKAPSDVARSDSLNRSSWKLALSTPPNEMVSIEIGDDPEEQCQESLHGPILLPDSWSPSAEKVGTPPAPIA